MTNYEKIKAMSVEEMATAISDSISSEPCDYCLYSDEKYCYGILCNRQKDSEIVAEWLNSEVEE